MKMNKIILILLLCIGLPSVTHAEQSRQEIEALAVQVVFDLAVKKFDAREYPKAFKMFTTLAQKGHVLSQSNLAMMYEKGIGTNRDYKKAVFWYRKAGEAGNGEAQYRMGNLYFMGLGVDMSNAVQAFQWYEKASNNLSGDFKLKHKALYQVALAYARGWGTTKSYWQAFTKFSLAGDYKDAKSQAEKMQAKMKKKIDGLSAEEHFKKGAEFNKNKKLDMAFKHVKVAAELGHTDAAYTLYRMYFNGLGTQRNIVEGKRWLVSVALTGHAQSQFDLGKYYFHQKKPKDATEWFFQVGENLARAGNKKAAADCAKALEDVSTVLKYEPAHYLATRLKEI